MPPVITTAEVTELADPKIRRIAMRVVKEMELAMEKAAANAAEPARFPLPPAPDATERLFRSRLQALTPEQRQLAGARGLSRATASQARRAKAFGDLAAVDLSAARPVAEQVQALPFPASLKLTPAGLQGLTELHGNILDVPASALTAGTNVAPVAGPVLDNLEFRLHQVRCLEETGSGLFSDVGEDEIALSGTSVDESGDTKKISEFRVGDFDDGDVKSFSPARRFTFFNLREGTAFPKSYFVTLVLAEKDMGGLGDFINRLLDKIKDRVTAMLAAALGAAIGASGGPVGAIIGAAVGFIVGKVFDLLKSLFADDIFPPRTVSVAVPSLNHRFPGGRTDSAESTVRFNGHGGEYTLTYDWRLVS
jgi:hypothetical protein